MKKILAISIIAMTAVTAANAEIASKAYVNQEDNTIKNTIIGALSGLNQGITNTSVVDAINSVATTANGGQTQQQVADAISTALNAYTETGQDDSYVAANDAISAGTHTKITYDAKGLVTAGSDIVLTDVTDVTATASEVNQLHSSGVTTADLTKLHGVTADVTELNYVDGVTSNIQTQLNSKLEASNIAGKQDSVIGDTSGADTNHPVIVNASGAMTVGANALGSAAYESAGGSVASGNTGLVSGGTVYTALQDYTPTANMGTYATDAEVSAFLGDGVTTTNTVTTQLAGKQGTISNVADTDATGTGVVKTVTQTNGQIAVTKGTVSESEIADHAVTLAKLSATMPAECTTAGSDCVLKSSDGVLAWEVIQRASNE